MNAALLAAAIVAVIFSPARADEVGVVAEEPGAGRSVAARGRYMVPYEQAIPGAEVSFTMTPIPGGVFRQGSPSDEQGRAEGEGPTIEVRVSPFWMGQCEVTWAEYQQFMRMCQVFERFDDLGMRRVTEDNQVDAVTAPSKLYDPSFTYLSGDAPELPAVSMSQYAAKQYTKWLSLLTGEFYRLPTESEWEHACRAGRGSAYSFRDASQIDDFAWYEGNADLETHAVAQKRPNPWGLYDMHGNAAEWVLDAYDAGWYATIAGRESPVVDPLNWPDKLFPCVLRGGSFDAPAEMCRSAARGKSDDAAFRIYDPNSPKSPWWFASDDSLGIGFRIVRPLAAPSRAEQERYWEADHPEIVKAVSRRIDEEGRGKRGLVDPGLPQAIDKARGAR